MNPLQSRLAALRSRLRLVVTVRGGCLAVTVLLGCLYAAGLFDWAVYRLLGVETWPLLRAGFLVGTLAGTGIVVYRMLFRPLSARTDDLSLALRVEEQYPILNDSLASTVQFLEQQGQGKPAVSPSMQKEAVERALRLAQGCDFFKAINARGLRWSTAALMLVLLLLLPLLWLGPAVARTALVRIADPFGEHSWQSTAAQTHLQVQCPNFLAYGQPLVITGDVRGEVPAKATVEFDSAAIATRTADIKKKSDGTGSFTFNIKLENPPREIRFRIRANDAVSPKQSGTWHVVALREPPQLVALNGKPSPQITLQRPRYADLPEFAELPAGTGNIDVLAGTLVTLKAAANRPIEHVWVEFRPEAPGTLEALHLAASGPRHLLDALITTGLAQSVSGRIPGKVDKNGTDFTVRFLPWVSGAYVLTIQDKDGLAKSYSFDQVVETDPVPVVDILRPSASQSVLANAELTLDILARDDRFALKTVWLEYRRKDKHGMWIDMEPKKLLFYDHEKAGQGLPLLLNSLAAAPVLWPAQPLRLRPRQLLISQRWSIKGLVIDGETLVIQACADDFCDVIAFRQPGRSIEVELKIIGRAALAGVVGEAEAKIQQQLIRLREMQEQAIKKVIGAEQQWRASGKLRPEDLLDIAEAEQLQKEIEARIGKTKDEGLRDDVAQLEQLMRDNKLPRSEISERLKLLRETLAKLSKDNLPKIEPSLAKARRDLEAPEKPEPPAPTDPGDLGNAHAEQNKVHQTLDELLHFMEDQLTLQQIKGELRLILKEQQDRQLELDKLIELIQKENLKAEVYLRGVQPEAELRKTAELQRRLADRLQKLLDRMTQYRERMKDKDESVAEMVAKALHIAQEEYKLVDDMLDVEAQLADDFDRPKKKQKDYSNKKQPIESYPRVFLARDQMNGTIKGLEAMLDALDQSRIVEVEKLIKKQKNEQKNIDDLAARQADLKKRIEDALKIPDAQERDKALKALAKEQRKLADEAAAKAREMERFQAHEAAADLEAASKKMERAALELDDGKAPDEELGKAQKKIDDARDKLKEAQEAAAEELSREKIAKIVDRLQGLKERQDGAIAESERLHKLVLQATRWERRLLDSLSDDVKSQLTIAGETGNLRELLKRAKVFHMVLDRTVKVMEMAAGKLEEHRVIAGPWQDLKVLGEKQLAEETNLVKVTVKYQKEASERLQNLIDALLPELEKADLEPKNDGGGGGGGQQPKGGLKAQDGIPPVAQLKVLKAEQQVVNDRTKEFATQYPDVSKLNRRERAELMAIHAEQAHLLDLFREMATSGKERGNHP